jgi:hypothetical protein
MTAICHAQSIALVCHSFCMNTNKLNLHDLIHFKNLRFTKHNKFIDKRKKYSSKNSVRYVNKIIEMKNAN